MEDNMWKLYVLRLNGTYKCFRCNSSGSWYDFQNQMVNALRIGKSYELEFLQLKARRMETLNDVVQPINISRGEPSPSKTYGTHTPVPASAAPPALPVDAQHEQVCRGMLLFQY